MWGSDRSSGLSHLISTPSDRPSLDHSCHDSEMKTIDAEREREKADKRKAKWWIN